MPAYDLDYILARLEAMRGNTGFTYATTSSYDQPAPETRRQPSTARYYILAADGRTVQLEPDAKKWAAFMAHDTSVRVKHDVLPGGTEVSTVFVGASLSVTPDVWQTAAKIPDEAWQVVRKYYTYEAALEGHESFVQRVRGGRAIRMREDGWV